MVTKEEKIRFKAVLENVLMCERERRGIGTLGERTLHSVLKNYFEPDTSNHEVKVGRYVADIKNGEFITEIQTRSFYSMRKKLTALTKEYKVNVVYPIAVAKHLSWVDPDSGEITSRRKSPKRGRISDILYELYALIPIMPLENLTFTVILLEMEEYKLLNGWSDDKKRGAHRYERIPTELCDIVTFVKPTDYLALIPEGLSTSFTAAEFAKAARITPRTAGYAMRALVCLGVIEHTSSKGRAYVYTIKR